MLNVDTVPSQKRASLKSRMDAGDLVRFPGAFSPIVAQVIERIGYDGVYISGGALANDLGLPDIGLTTLTEVAMRGRQISRVTNLPTIIDADTGFGEATNAGRTVVEFEAAGLSGCHFEDQVNPKRCGHLGGKQLVEPDVMIQKLRAAVRMRTDPNFLLIARTDARGVLGFDAAVERARAYVDAGADMIFPEALKDENEFRAFRAAVDAPLLANMTEFGKSPIFTLDELRDLGYNLVIYPVTSLRFALKAIEDGLTRIYEDGTQRHLLDDMLTRKRLYDIVDYEAYNAFDQSIFDFRL
ncbi:MAG: methylisocitrate lyase [Bacteroidota bacterium]